MKNLIPICIYSFAADVDFEIDLIVVLWMCGLGRLYLIRLNFVSTFSVPHLSVLDTVIR